MRVLERRYPTRAAMESLASRFGFDLTRWPQDPEIEWAEAKRIDEFVATYERAQLTDDERFLLMAMLVNSFNSADEPLDAQPLWQRTLELVERDIDVHIFTVLHFADMVPDDDGWEWPVEPDLRAVAARHRGAFGLS
jgi:hypothetical protein